jgi:hypothetical protein
LGFQRTLGSETTLVLINFGDKAARASIDKLARSATLVQRHPKNEAKASVNARGVARVRVAARSVQVYSVQLH